jgi:hypothetical protein
MKKLNLICAAMATVFSVGVANAGSAVSTATSIAVESFGGSAGGQEAIAVLGAPISYSLAGLTAINSGATIYFTIRLTGGKFVAAPTIDSFADKAVAGKEPRFTLGGLSCYSDAAAAGKPKCVTSVSSDGSTAKVAITVAETMTLGLGAFAWSPRPANIIAVNNTLNAVGGKVTASIGLTTADPGSTTALDSTKTQATIDAPLASGDLAVAARAITGAISASAYTGKIDLTVTPPATDYTTTGFAVLGQYKFTDATTKPKNTAGIDDYDLANGGVTGGVKAPNTGASVTVTPGTGQSFPVGAVLTLSSAITCTPALAGAGNTATITDANKATVKTLTTTAAVVTGTNYFVCMTKPTPTTNAATPIQATIAATVIPAYAVDSIAAASGSGYSLAYNGSQYDVQSYWPGALSAYKFAGYLRLTNTGTVAADVTAQNFTTAGALNAAQPAKVITNLLAGESKLMSTLAIDAIIGANPSNLVAGRVRVTAPTNGLRVISMMQADGAQLIEYPNVNYCTTSGTVSGGNGSVAIPDSAQASTTAASPNLAGTGAAAISGGAVSGTISTVCTGANSQ